MSGAEEAKPDAIIVTDRRAEAALQRTPQQTPAITAVDNSPAALVRLGMENNLTAEQLAPLFEMMREHDKDEARKEFAEAMTRFSTLAPGTVSKGKHVKFGNVNYKHAELGDFVLHSKRLLGEAGFHQRWDFEQWPAAPEPPKIIEVTCVIIHRRGHISRTSLRSRIEPGDQKRNAYQDLCSAVTYLERYTLKAALGLAEHGDDDDARLGAKQGEPPRGRAPKEQNQRDRKPGPDPGPGSGDSGRATAEQLERLYELGKRMPKEAQQKLGRRMDKLEAGEKDGRATAERLISNIETRLEAQQVPPDDDEPPPSDGAPDRGALGDEGSLEQAEGIAADGPRQGASVAGQVLEGEAARDYLNGQRTDPETGEVTRIDERSRLAGGDATTEQIDKIKSQLAKLRPHMCARDGTPGAEYQEHIATFDRLSSRSSADAMILYLEDRISWFNADDID